MPLQVPGVELTDSLIRPLDVAVAQGGMSLTSGALASEDDFSFCYGDLDGFYSAVEAQNTFSSLNRDCNDLRGNNVLPGLETSRSSISQQPGQALREIIRETSDNLSALRHRVEALRALGQHAFEVTFLLYPKPAWLQPRGCRPDVEEFISDISDITKICHSMQVKVKLVGRGSGHCEHLPLQLRFCAYQLEQFLSALTMTTSILHRAGALPLPPDRIVCPADREERNYALDAVSARAQLAMTQLHPLASSFTPQFVEGHAAPSSSSGSWRPGVMEAVRSFTDETDV